MRPWGKLYVRIRCERSPLPIKLRRVCDCSCSRCLCSASSRRAASSAIARVLLRCCERSSWHSTTMPLGRCVMRMAESVLLTCWPPAPDARKVSMRRSPGSISTSSISSASGSTATVAADVWMRPCDSVSGTRCTRWPPDSNLSRAQALAPVILAMISLNPPCSPSLELTTSVRHERFSSA